MNDKPFAGLLLLSYKINSFRFISGNHMVYYIVKRNIGMENIAIGIDLGGTNLKGIVINERGEGRHIDRKNVV
jgi:activator of 2-hydroxyglutaryl-CoA dehydratase